MTERAGFENDRGTSSDEHLLEVTHLATEFVVQEGVVRAVDDVSFYVRRNEVVGMVGETGCGKSVTAKVILGSLPIPPGEIKRGEVVFHGQNLLVTNTKKRKQLLKEAMSYIPQDPMTSLNPVFTIGQQMVDLIKWHSYANVGLGGLLGIRGRKQNKPAKKKAVGLLDYVNIPAPDKVVDSYPIELSGGMRQRVLIAMALIGSSELLIADEPTTALDVTIQKGILDLLQGRIEERGMAILYITHNLGVARRLCAKICVMYAGTVVEAGSTANLLENPAHPYTAGLINSVPKLTKESYAGIEGTLPDYLWPPSGCRFHPRCQHAEQVCRDIPPAPRQIADGRLVSCHLIERLI